MKSSTKRETLKRLSTVGIFASAGIAGLIQAALANGAKSLKPGIHRIKGDVTVNGKPAQAGMSVDNDAAIVTGADSEAIFVIGQDAYLQREKSSVSFTGKAAGATAGVMRVLTGGILSVFGKGDKKLLTPTATIGIRGTGCYIEAEADRVYFCLCYGSAEVSPTTEPNQIRHIVTKHHEQPIYIHKNSPLPTMTKAPMINHTDAELELLESLVGRLPPFAENDYRY
jgi:hypothetical protein